MLVLLAITTSDLPSLLLFEISKAPSSDLKLPRAISVKGACAAAAACCSSGLGAGSGGV
jgi:hypothetical protein